MEHKLELRGLGKDRYLSLLLMSNAKHILDEVLIIFVSKSAALKINNPIISIRAVLPGLTYALRADF